MTTGIAMPRWTKAGWARLRQVADDRDELQDTLAEYDRKAERIARRFAAQGVSVAWLHLDAGDVDDLARWCRANGYRIDQTGRAAYGAVRLAATPEPEGAA